MRREQSITRSDLAAIERDEVNGGILKVNPLLDWSEEQLLCYSEERRLPKNRLYSQGYRSIGCAPCTRAVLSSEDARAGRWWWENPENKECGLHKRE
jgi:phosphoadenosine phosphosulfate reductase